MSTEVLVKNILHFCCCSVVQLSLTLCNPMDCNMPDFLVLHYLPELAQTHIHWVSYAIPPSCALSSTSPPPSIFPSIRVFSISQFFASRDQRTGASALASVLPMNIQDWFPLGLTGLWYVLIDFKFSTEYNYWLSADYVCVFSHFSCVWLFVTLWTIARQAPLSMGFSR